MVVDLGGIGWAVAVVTLSIHPVPGDAFWQRDTRFTRDFMVELAAAFWQGENEVLRQAEEVTGLDRGTLELMLGRQSPPRVG